MDSIHIFISYYVCGDNLLRKPSCIKLAEFLQSTSIVCIHGIPVASNWQVTPDDNIIKSYRKIKVIDHESKNFIT